MTTTSHISRSLVPAMGKEIASNFRLLCRLSPETTAYFFMVACRMDNNETSAQNYNGSHGRDDQENRENYDERENGRVTGQK